MTELHNAAYKQRDILTDSDSRNFMYMSLTNQKAIKRDLLISRLDKKKILNEVPQTLK